MSRCIIHAGMPRTGTKSIQYSLMALDDDRFFYAPLSAIPGFPNHTAALRNLYTPPRDPRHQKLVERFGREEFDKAVADAKAGMKFAFAGAGGRDMVLSADGLMRMSTAGLTRMSNALERRFGRLEVIAYVRSPLSYVESMLQQRIREGHAEAFNLRALWPHYEKNFSRLDAGFGREQVMLVKYDPARFTGGDVVMEFCQRFGIPAASVAPVRRNGPLTRVAAQLLHQYALAVKAGEAKAMGLTLAGLLADRLAELDPAPFRLAPELLAPVTAGHEGDIAWMSERLGESLDETLEPGRGTITSLDDLAQPVPDAAARLAALIAADGGAVDDIDSESVPALLARLAETAQGKQAVVVRKAGGVAAPVRKIAAKKDAAGASKRNYNDMALPRRERLKPTPLTVSPTPLINKDKNLVVLWSPKSACTTAYVWFSHISGFAADVKNYANWPHKHRTEQFQRSQLYVDSAKSGMPGATVLKIIRDPYGRAVSIYRHALQTKFADVEVEAWSGGAIDANRGYSFQTFLDMIETFDMTKVDVHFRPQFHPFETKRGIDRVVNISKADMFEQLNAFEEEQGWPRTDFAELNWLHNLESRRKAKQEPMEGEALDEVPFSRHQVKTLGAFPSYAQLLTPRARQRIEAIYKADFDAYGKYL